MLLSLLRIFMKQTLSNLKKPVCAFSFWKLILKQKILHKNQAPGIMMKSGRKVLKLTLKVFSRDYKILQMSRPDVMSN